MQDGVVSRQKKARQHARLLVFPEERRYVVRSGSAAEAMGGSRMSLGGRHVRVRGYDKVLAHLMFGMTVLIGQSS